jgi:hypothetical protein
MAKESTMPTSRASLCALGKSLKRCCFFAPLREQGQVPQKTMVRQKANTQIALEMVCWLPNTS